MVRLFRVFVPTAVVLLLVCEALLVSVSFFAATWLVLGSDPTTFLLYDGGIGRLLPVLLCMLFGLYLNDLYSNLRVRSWLELVQQLCFVVSLALLLEGMVSYVQFDARVPIRIMLAGSAISAASVFLLRAAYSALVLRDTGTERLLMVGESPLLEDIARYLDVHPELRMAVVGYVTDEYATGGPFYGAKMLGPLDKLVDIAAAVEPNRIVVGMAERRRRMPVSELLDLSFSGFLIQEAHTLYESIASRVSLRQLNPSALIFSRDLGPRQQQLLVQSTLNFVLALGALVVASPVMLLTAVAVKLTSSGPVLYRQTRVGRHGVPFTIYKFRSMRCDAEAATGAVWASKNDPRITPLGRFLRKTRIDELPQLFNVLRGDMSIVGPRPERPEFVGKLAAEIPYYQQRHAVKPGITGWAQINHKYGDTLDDVVVKLEYDLYYIKNLSLVLDLYIMFHTVKAMLLTRGAQ